MNTPTQSPAVATHTPTPWHVGMKPGPFIYGPQGEQIADLTGALSFNAGHNAAFIVRACNSHAQLVAALTDIETTARNTANTFPNMPGRVDLLRIAMNARAALQAAKE